MTQRPRQKQMQMTNQTFLHPRHKPWGWLLLGALLVALNIGKVLYANELSSTCRELGELEADRERLTNENQALRNDLSQLSSLALIKSRAEELGMVRAVEVGVDYLTPALLASR